MPITRTPQIDDDGSGTTGTVWNNAWKTELYNQIDGLVTPIMPLVIGGHVDLTHPGGEIHNWPIPTNTVVYIGGSNGNITGLTAPSGNGTIKIFLSTAPTIVFKHQSTGSAAGNRLIGVGYADTVLAPWKSQVLYYSLGLGAWVCLT